MSDVNRPQLVKKLRATAGITQQQLADILGVSKRTVIRWETGQSKERIPDDLPSWAKWFLLGLRIYAHTGLVPPPFTQDVGGPVTVDYDQDPLEYLVSN